MVDNIIFGIGGPDYPIVTGETRFWDDFEISINFGNNIKFTYDKLKSVKFEFGFSTLDNL